MGSCPSSSSGPSTTDMNYASKCIDRGIISREKKDFRAALRWFEEALAVREAFFGVADVVNFNGPLVEALILIGEVHFWDGRIDRSLYYFLRANDLLDAKMDIPAIRKTTAVTQFVNVTAGLVLTYNRIAENEQLDPVNRAIIDTLEGLQPLELAEQQLTRCIAVVTAAEGSRSATLIPLLHMLSRVLMATKKSVQALRVMQRCLGLTLHVAQTLQIYSFLSYTRNVLDAVKRCARKDQAAYRILGWWRKRQADKAAASAASRSPPDAQQQQRDLSPFESAQQQVPPMLPGTADTTSPVAPSVLPPPPFVPGGLPPRPQGAAPSPRRQAHVVSGAAANDGGKQAAATIAASSGPSPMDIQSNIFANPKVDGVDAALIAQQSLGSSTNTMYTMLNIVNTNITIAASAGSPG